MNPSQHESVQKLKDHLATVINHLSDIDFDEPNPPREPFTVTVAKAEILSGCIDAIRVIETQEKTIQSLLTALEPFMNDVVRNLLRTTYKSPSSVGMDSDDPAWQHILETYQSFDQLRGVFEAVQNGKDGAASILLTESTFTKN